MQNQDFAWLVENSTDLFQKYPGKWIAVRDGKVIGVGDTAPQAADEANQKVDDGQFILEAIDKEADVIYGCS